MRAAKAEGLLALMTCVSVSSNFGLKNYQNHSETSKERCGPRLLKGLGPLYFHSVPKFP